jgi:hypothetical protein
MGQPRHCHQAAPRVAATQNHRKRQEEDLADAANGEDAHAVFSFP